MKETTRRAVLYVRLSDTDSTESLADQEQRCRNLAKANGWEVVHTACENDQEPPGTSNHTNRPRKQRRSHASAYKRQKILLPNGKRELRTIRPEFRRVLDMLTTGQADALVALDLDRVARDPRDLEDLIDAVESTSPRIPVASVTGSLKLANDADVTMARVLVAMANKSSRDTARRVSAARERNADEGTYAGGGYRPYGYADDLTLIESEAAITREMTEAIIAGRTLRSLAADLNLRKVPTGTSAPWSASKLRQILLGPRNAGISTYQGQERGTGKWQAIVSRDDWDECRLILTSPARRTQRGNQVRWQGSCIYRCGVCGSVLCSTLKAGRYQSYVCRERGCTKIKQAPVDALIREAVILRLSRPDAAGLLAPADDYASRGSVLAAERRKLRGKLTA